ncbi:uncharacterized protein LOC120177440 [Hibiscus syriacus]|uniref:uncharacterized protein LOC120177440 n=1 Tax=Hibiscus syriacus TaxID=106335 RepID=UPI001922AC1F|nr:uncharacterized protein LOC120177440 [Hibiscus syriacus]
MTVVVKLLGRYNSLRSKLYDLWKSKPQSDFLNAISVGPWTIFGNYLTVETWSIEFSTTQPYPQKAGAWIHLSGLPVTLYKRGIINEMGECMRLVVRMDYRNDSGRQGRFARMAVTIDLHKPLVSKLLISGNIQIVEYESLPRICFSYGKYGHVQDHCPDLAPKVDTAPTADQPSADQPPLDSSAPFGPWMVVERRQRRSIKKQSEATVPTDNIIIVASKFKPIF